MITINNLPKDTQSKVLSVDKPGVIGPFKTELGFVVYRINSISAPVVKTLADEYENLKARIGTTKATEELARIMTFVNDELAGGLTLEEIANSTQMEYGKLEPKDQGSYVVDYVIDADSFSELELSSSRQLAPSRPPLVVKSPATVVV